MRGQSLPLLVTSLLLIGASVDALGVNWGRMASHPLPPGTVVQLLKDNGITKVKLVDEADESVMKALAGTGIEVVVSVSNNKLAAVAGDYNQARKWVDDNVVRYTGKDGVEIKYIAVGNEPFNQVYNGSLLDVTFPGLKNIQTALNEAHVGGKIKATIPFNSDVSATIPPSKGKFREDIHDHMVKIVQFLAQNGAPFTVNVYPFLSLYQDPTYPIVFTFFDNPFALVDNGSLYHSTFDMKMDALLSALKAVGFPNLPIVVGRVGWPTDGHEYASPAYAQRFYRGLLKKLAENQGTPLRPGHIEAYLFSLIDEDAKSIAAGNFERHWGIFSYDGKPKFPVDLSGKGQRRSLVAAKNVKYLPRKWCVLSPHAKNLSLLSDNMGYACTFSDCTSLGVGSSCANLNARDKTSYAFNMYYQTQNHRDGSCDFQGLSMVTTNLASHGICKFPVQIMASAE